MIKERYVNFEVASLLRDKGFDECVHAWHNVYDKVNLDFRIAIDAPHLQIPAPTQSMACDWIEEEYGIFIQINRDNQYYEGREVIAVTKEDIERGHMTMYYASVFDKYSLSNTTEHYDSIESAYNEALRYVLTNLI